ncbi:MAG: HEAT repeat domain-containing protein [bacterium]|nr:HEAT repeat domain-containing protein [bacterium]
MGKLLIQRLIIVLLAAGIFIFPATAAKAQEDTGPAVEQLLSEIGAIPTADKIRELFINTSEWDAEHEELRYISHDALVELGVVVVPTLLEGWLSSVDIRRRIELDNIVKEIGFPAAEYIIPWLENDDPYTRRHAAALLGDTAWINKLEDPMAIGPIDADLNAIEAIKTMLATETEWDVISNAVAALGMFRDPGQIGFLSSYLNNEEEAVRRSAVLGLSKIPDQRVVPEIIKAFDDPVTTVRQTAVLALATPTMGNLAFEALIGGAILSPSGETARLCALESIARYLENIGIERTEIAHSQRFRAYDTAVSIIANPTTSDWLIRGYAVVIIGNSYHPDAAVFLQGLLSREEHPFVVGKINEAISTLEAGMPEPPEDKSTE